MKKSLMLTIVGAGVLGSAHAQLIEGFEENGFVLPTVNSPWTDSLSTTTGVTQGTHALDVTVADTTFQWVQLTIPVADASFLATDSTISFDVTMGATTSQWAGFLIAFNSASGWGQASAGVNPTLSTTGTSFTQVTFNLPTVDGGSAYNWGGVTNWLQLQIGLNTQAATVASPVNFYIDNIQATPEPASYAFLGLGALALIRRRRARR